MMKLRVVLELEDIEQVGTVLALVKPWNINVDVAPMISPTVKKRSITRKKSLPKISSPTTQVRYTGEPPAKWPEIFNKLKIEQGKPVARKDLAWEIARIKKHKTTKATSTIVTRWIKDGVLEVVS